MSLRLQPEPSWVIERVCQQTGASNDLVSSVISDLHHVVDAFVADDCSVVLDPLLFRRAAEPVWDHVVRRFGPADWREMYGLKALPTDELAIELGVPVETLAEYPLVFSWEVLEELFTWRDLVIESPDNDIYERIFRAWRTTFNNGEDIDRRYRVSHVGLERDFETWLVQRPELLNEFDYPVELFARQARLNDGRVLDLLYRVTLDADPIKRGDWLVVENKATAVSVAAHAQLQHYVDDVQQQYATGGETAFGLLIADGRTVELQAALAADGLGYLSLAELGYRDHLYRTHLLTTVPDATDMSTAPTQVSRTPVELPGGPDRSHSAPQHDMARQTYEVSHVMDGDSKVLGTAEFTYGSYVGGTWSGVRNTFAGDLTNLTYDDIAGVCLNYVFTLQQRPNAE